MPPKTVQFFPYIRLHGKKRHFLGKPTLIYCLKAVVKFGNAAFEPLQKYLGLGGSRLFHCIAKLGQGFELFAKKSAQALSFAFPHSGEIVKGRLQPLKNRGFPDFSAVLGFSCLSRDQNAGYAQQAIQIGWR